MIPMVKISQTKKTRALYLACVLRYTSAKIRSFLKNGLYFGRPLYFMARPFTVQRHERADLPQKFTLRCTRPTDGTSFSVQLLCDTRLYSVVRLRYYFGAVGRFYWDTMTKLAPDADFKVGFDADLSVALLTRHTVSAPMRW